MYEKIRNPKHNMFLLICKSMIIPIIVGVFILHNIMDLSLLYYLNSFIFLSLVFTGMCWVLSSIVKVWSKNIPYTVFYLILLPSVFICQCILLIFSYELSFGQLQYTYIESISTYAHFINDNLFTNQYDWSGLSSLILVLNIIPFVYIVLCLAVVIIRCIFDTNKYYEYRHKQGNVKG